ncbi:group II intron reverse transcriptase/maturase [Pendulispora albinea]|uniref:RNA-directed DNA polymerase n=1 Tax=Pendulispora albinea TaxID=2741071 RepID=A0ABZ2LT14_9BACT
MTPTKPFAISKRMVWEAFKAVKANKGAPGIDGQSIESFEQNLARNLYCIWNRLASGSYFPPPVLQVEIPKRDGGVRELGVPTVGDRVAQTVVAMHLGPITERQFHPDSYGYRPGRSAHQAVEQARQRCWRYPWALDLDIRAFFDSLNHSLMMRAVRRFTEERWVLLYVERWLKASVQRSNGHIEPSDRGTPQGGVVSPVLANIFLHLAFDRWMNENFPDVPFERYADDVLVHCRSKADAERMRREIAERLQRCGLQLHPEKTRVVCCRPDAKKVEAKSFDFLGFTFRPRIAKSRTGQIFTTFGPAISGKAAKSLRATMRRTWRVPHRTEMSLNDLAEKVNPALRGWIRYYGRFRPTELVSVFNGINLALRIWAMRKYKRFKRRPLAAKAWLHGIATKERGLFAHWGIPALFPTVAAGR